MAEPVAISHSQIQPADSIAGNLNTNELKPLCGTEKVEACSGHLETNEPGNVLKMVNAWFLFGECPLFSDGMMIRCPTVSYNRFQSRIRGERPPLQSSRLTSFQEQKSGRGRYARLEST